MMGWLKMASSSLVCSGEATQLFEAALLERETVAVYFVKMLMDPGECNCYPANSLDFSAPLWIWPVSLKEWLYHYLLKYENMNKSHIFHKTYYYQKVFCAKQWRTKHVDKMKLFISLYERQGTFVILNEILIYYSSSMFRAKSTWERDLSWFSAHCIEPNRKVGSRFHCVCMSD